jgi:hypothetical protein
LWGLGIELASYHLSDAKNLEGTSRFFENLWSPRLGCVLDGWGYTFWQGLENVSFPKIFRQAHKAYFSVGTRVSLRMK